METDRIIEFKVLSEELNFRKAAARLAMSQSSLSRHIDDLEHQIGFRLFIRDRHRVSLTPQGVKLLPEVTDLPERLLHAIETARPSPPVASTPMVRLSYGRTRGLELVELALSALHAGTRAIEVSLIQSGADQIVPSLINMDVDLAFIRPPVPSSALRSRLLVDELLGAVMREDNPLAASPTISISDLMDHPFISVREPSGIPVVDSLSATMKGRGLTPHNIVSEADSITSMFLLVESGLGIGLARQAVFRRANTPGLVIRTIDPALPGIPLCVAWRTQHEADAVLELVDVIVACRSRLGTGYRIAPDA